MSRASSHPLNDLRSLSVDMAVTSETRLTIFCGYEMFLSPYPLGGCGGFTAVIFQKTLNLKTKLIFLEVLDVNNRDSGPGYEQQ